MYSGAFVGSGARAGIAAKSGRSFAGVAEPLGDHTMTNAEVRGFPFLFGDEGARLITDTGGRILWLSRAAKAVAKAGSCLLIDKGELTGRTRHSQRILRQLLDDALASAGPVDQLLASAANELPEIFVRACSCSGQPQGAVAITVKQLNRNIDHIPDLMRLYGLTRTEEQITKMMLQGLSVTEIAEQLHKSVLTVRTHSKRTYLKLNVGTKEQLFSAVLRLMVD